MKFVYSRTIGNDVRNSVHFINILVILVIKFNCPFVFDSCTGTIMICQRRCKILFVIRHQRKQWGHGLMTKEWVPLKIFIEILHQVLLLALSISENTNRSHFISLARNSQISQNTDFPCFGTIIFTWKFEISTLHRGTRDHSKIIFPRYSSVTRRSLIDDLLHFEFP